MNDFADKLEAFRARLELEMNAATAQRHPVLDLDAKENGRRGYHEIGIDKPGPRFIRIYDESGLAPARPDRKPSRTVRYFVERETGVIFGAKGWTAYNPNRVYGTLETLDEYAWGGYYAVPFDEKVSTLVPKSARR